MAVFVSGPDVSSAWVAGLEALLDAGGDVVNLTVAMDDPSREHDSVRAVLDEFNGARRKRDRRVQLISTIANTIFPQAWYQEHLGEAAEEHLYEIERTTRHVSRRRNRTGTYFERMVAWPTADGESFNQLDHVIARFRSAKAKGHQRANAAELGLAHPVEDAIAVPIVVNGKDRQTMGFPCLSHLSFSLNGGVLHLGAVYRSHDFISRAYGNYVGLGRVLGFVAQQSGFPVGELACLSSSASAEVGKSGIGKASLDELLRKCRIALSGAT